MIVFQICRSSPSPHWTWLFRVVIYSWLDRWFWQRLGAVLTLLLSEGASGSEVATGTENCHGCGLDTSLATESATAFLSRTRSWSSWCRRTTDHYPTELESTLDLSCPLLYPASMFSCIGNLSRTPLDLHPRSSLKHDNRVLLFAWTVCCERDLLCLKWVDPAG